MIDDILYDPLFLVFESPIDVNGQTALSVSYDGDNYEFNASSESISIFVN